MATRNDQYFNEQDAAERECFLCTLDPEHACHEAQLEGRIVAAQDRVIAGTHTPTVLLDTGTSLVEVRLPDQYYRSLIRELKARGDVVGSYNLTLRVYHLPNAPLTSEYKGGTRLRYQANSYTLAVLEPDMLLNITDLNQAEYCPRQHLLNRLIPSQPSAATLRGNLVHHCFKELLKEHDRGRFNPSATESSEQPESALAALHRHLEQALDLYSIDMALADISVEAMRADVAPHLESLARWYERERNTLWDMPTAYADQRGEGNQVRAETFLLAPEIGLRGRLDLFWQQAGRQRLLELKTGGASGELPKRDHRWQVYGYHALLMVRRDSKMQKALATLLYTGTPGSAQAFGVPATIREIQRVNETRNILVLSRVTNIPTAPPGPHRCTKCALLTSCQRVSSILYWQPPEPAPQAAAHPLDPGEAGSAALQTHAPDPPPPLQDASEDRDFFARYYRLLHIEGRVGDLQQALLWHRPVAERIQQGTAISGLEIEHAPAVEKEGWLTVFRCHNTSELREGDEILLSNGDPITGEVVTGTIMAISSEQVTTWTRELIAHPTLIDRYENDLVHVRTLQNLLRWLQADAHLRDLVAGRIRPRFLEASVARRPDFNAEQNLAVERALQMQDYLLIHGPPGTGKTSVIAEIVKHMTARGQRVMLAAFTNQAVDNMLKRLDREGFHNYLRLGHERSVAESVRPRLLKELATTPAQIMTIGRASEGSTATLPQQEHVDGTLVRSILQTIPVIATTTATWSSDRYSPLAGDTEALEAGLYFDVAIIDEAGQLTVPAILGALRLAKRFILVGDEKQLPPLVLSKEAAEEGLADSLFRFLKQLDEEYMQRHPLTIGACVPLRTQYRMNKWISHFSSTVFYEKQLLAHESVANRRLVYRRASPLPASEAPALLKALDPKYPLIFLDVRAALDTHPSHELSETQMVEESKISTVEARTVRAVVAGLLARGIAPQDIGIIAPYRAQVAHIRRHLFSADPIDPTGPADPTHTWQALPSNSPISVDTVDRFQGGERLVIILSLATTQEPASASPRREFLINPHRLNVALTRAQRKLIVVGCAPALENLPIFSRLITYCRSMDTLILSL